MGLWLTLWGSTFIAAIILAIIFRNKNDINLVFGVPVFLFIFAGLIVISSSSRTFEEQKFTTIDKIVNISTFVDENGKSQLVFPSFDGKVEKFDNFKFDENIASGDKMQVRIIRRETPRSFCRRASKSDKAILIIPEEVRR
jgi:hypothetical protein